MVVRIRLARHGTRNNPFYHVVAINDAKPRDARPIEKLGEYDPIPRLAPTSSLHLAIASKVELSKKPKTKETGSSSSSSSSSSPGNGLLMTSGITNQKPQLSKRIEWNTERIKYWLKIGAQPSKPVARLLERAGLIPDGVFYKGMTRHFFPDAPAPAPPATATAPIPTATTTATPPTPATPPPTPKLSEEEILAILTPRSPRPPKQSESLARSLSQFASTPVS